MVKRKNWQLTVNEGTAVIIKIFLDLYFNLKSENIQEKGFFSRINRIEVHRSFPEFYIRCL